MVTNTTDIFKTTGDVIVDIDTSLKKDEKGNYDGVFKGTAQLAVKHKVEDKDILFLINKGFVNSTDTFITSMKDIKTTYLQKLVDLYELSISNQNNSIKYISSISSTLEKLETLIFSKLDTNFLNLKELVNLSNQKEDIKTSFIEAIESLRNGIRIEFDYKAIAEAISIEKDAKNNSKRISISNAKALSSGINILNDSLTGLFKNLKDVKVDSETIESVTNLLNWFSDMLGASTTSSRKKYFLFGETIQVEKPKFSSKNAKRITKSIDIFIDGLKNSLEKLQTLKIEKSFQTINNFMKYLNDFYNTNFSVKRFIEKEFQLQSIKNLTSKFDKIFKKISKTTYNRNRLNQFLSDSVSLSTTYNNIKLPGIIDSVKQYLILDNITKSVIKQFERISEAKINSKKLRNFFVFTNTLSESYSTIRFNILLSKKVSIFKRITNSFLKIFDTIGNTKIENQKIDNFLINVKNIISVYNKLIKVKLDLLKPFIIKQYIDSIQDTVLDAYDFIRRVDIQETSLEKFSNNSKSAIAALELWTSKNTSLLSLFENAKLFFIYQGIFSVLKEIDNLKKVNISKFVKNVNELTSVAEVINNIGFSVKNNFKFVFLNNLIPQIKEIFEKISSYKHIEIDTFLSDSVNLVTGLNKIPAFNSKPSHLLLKPSIFVLTSVLNFKYSKNNHIDTFLSDSVNLVTGLNKIPAFNSKQFISIKILPSILSSIFSALSIINKQTNKKILDKLTVFNTIVDNIKNISDKLKDVKIPVFIGVQLSSLALGLFAISKVSAIKKPFLASFSKFIDILSSKNAKESGKTIKAISSGIATLGIALAAFGALAPVMMVGALAFKAVGFVINSVTSKKEVKQLSLYTASLAMFGVAIWAFGEVVTGESMLKTAGGLVLLYGCLRLFSGDGLKFGKYNIPGSKQSIWKNVGMSAAALASLGLAIHYGWKNVEMTDMATAAAGLTEIGAAAFVWSKLKLSTSFSKDIALIGGGIAAIGIGMQAWKNVSISNVLTAIGAVTGFAYVAKLYGKNSPTVGLSMSAIGVGVGAIGFGMLPWKSIDASSSLNAVITVGLLSGIAALMAPVAINAGIAGGAMVLIGAGVAAIGAGLKMFPNDGELMLKAGTFITVLAAEAAALGLISPIALAGAAVFPILGSGIALLGAGLKGASKATPETVDTVTYAISSFSHVLGDNLWAITKSIPAAAGFAIVAGAMALVTPILWTLSKISVDKNTLQNNIDSVGVMVDSIILTIDRNKNKLKTAKEGINAIAGIGTLLSDLADGMVAMADLKFPVYKVQNGKLVLVGVREFTKNDFDRIGNGIGTIIESLAGPLSAVGSSEQVITIAGKPITNLFASNSVKKGISALSGIGDIINPIVNGIKVLSDKAIIENPKVVDNFGMIIANILQSLSSVLSEIGSEKQEFKVFGIKVTNPFASNSVKKGIKSFEKIGLILSPITDSIKTFVDINGQNSNANTVVDTFNKNIVSVLSNLSVNVVKYSSKLDDIDFDLKWFKSVSEYVKDGIKTFNEVKTDAIEFYEKNYLNVLNWLLTWAKYKDDINDIKLDLSWVQKIGRNISEGFTVIKNADFNAYEAIVNSITKSIPNLKLISETRKLKFDFSWINSFNLAIRKVDIQSFEKFNNTFSSVYNKLSQIEILKKSNDQLNKVQTNIAKIKTSLNGMNLKTVIHLDHALSQLAEINRTGTLTDLVEAIKELVEKIGNIGETQTNNQSQFFNNIQQSLVPALPQVAAQQSSPVAPVITNNTEKEKDSEIQTLSASDIEGAIISALRQLGIDGTSIFQR